MVSAVLRTILVTGGAGYIGTHTVLQLLQQGFRVVVIDNLDNASEVALARVADLAAGAGHNNLVFHKKIPLVFAGQRPGDAEMVYAATAKAEKELKWKAKYGVEEMCRDLWNWASKNPYGYAGSSDKSN